MIVAVLALVFAAALTLTVGVRDGGFALLFQALTAFDPTDPAHIAIQSIRMPRLIAGLIAGAALGMAGTIMQAITRNPLADPGILGINAGAAFAVVIGSLIAGRADNGLMAALAFPGAAAAAIAVFALGGGLKGDAGPVRLTLAGVALSAMLLSFVSAIILARNEALEVFRFWVTGSLAQAGMRPLGYMAIAAVLGAGLAIAIAPRIEALSLGSALARGLGTNPGRIQLGALVAVTALTGAAVGVAGPIAFLGLLVPRLARRVGGHVLRRELIAAAILGATILLFADTIGRILIPPAEIRVGTMTALIGAPIFIWMARRLRAGAGA
ncbi:iron ABC transporter permease [Neorhizobium sp. JUb45]|uniref:FecCD family ABC transporter permease n=1 Tax=unclassified Neorhizobium TaxID=2629175 RepID=UPI00104CF7AB|nr:iron ABC transporter permease [Neorhizobium sp. JUb45]